MGYVRKIKSALVKQDVEAYVGEESYMFYDTDTGALRIWDGTPGGRPITGYFVEYDSIDVFPAVGEASVVYMDTSADILYHWNGSSYDSLTANITTLGDLTDTDIVSPPDNAILTYNGTTEKWEAVQDGTLGGLVTGVVITESNLNSLKLSINSGDDTLLDIAPGKCMFVDTYTDPENPTIITIEINDPIIGYVPDPPITGRSAFVYIELTYYDEELEEWAWDIKTMQDFAIPSTRSRVVIGRPFNSVTGAGPAMTNIADLRLPVNGTNYTGRDNIFGIDSYKIKGGKLTRNATNYMRLDIAEITCLRPFVLAGTTPENPNIVTDAGQVGVSSYAYHLQGTSTTTTQTQIQSTTYDDNGVLTALPSNRWVCQRVYYFPKSRTFHIVHGQRHYGTSTDAYHDILRDVVLNDGILFASALIGYLLIKYNCDDLNDSTQAVIINTRGP